jgi:hypothetical protein
MQPAVVCITLRLLDGGEQGEEMFDMRQGKMARRWRLLALGGTILVILGISAGTFALVNRPPAAASGSGGEGGACLPPQGKEPVCHFSGFSADARYSSVDTTVCADGVYTDIYVFAGEGVTKDPPGPPEGGPQASVFLTRYNACTYQYDQFSNATWEQVDVRVTGRLDTATLQATIPWDGVGGDPSRVIHLDVTWKGFGDIASTSVSKTTRMGNIMLKTKMDGENRMAMVNGVVTYGDERYTITGTTTISSAKGGTIATAIVHS